MSSSLENHSLVIELSSIRLDTAMGTKVDKNRLDTFKAHYQEWLEKEKMEEEEGERKNVNTLVIILIDEIRKFRVLNQRMRAVCALGENNINAITSSIVDEEERLTNWESFKKKVNRLNKRK